MNMKDSRVPRLKSTILPCPLRYRAAIKTSRLNRERNTDWQSPIGIAGVKEAFSAGTHRREMRISDPDPFTLFPGMEKSLTG